MPKPTMTRLRRNRARARRLRASGLAAPTTSPDLSAGTFRRLETSRIPVSLTARHPIAFASGFPRFLLRAADAPRSRLMPSFSKRNTPVMTPAPVDADSPELAALRGPACLLDVADGEVPPGEAGSDAFGVVSHRMSSRGGVGARRRLVAGRRRASSIVPSLLPRTRTHQTLASTQFETHRASRHRSVSRARDRSHASTSRWRPF